MAEKPYHGTKNQEEGMLVAEEDQPMNTKKPPPSPLSSSASSTNNIWPISNPFVNGALIGLCTSNVRCLGSLVLGSRSRSIQCVDTVLKEMLGSLLLEAAYTSVQLGSFETLTRKVDAANRGVPRTLYQDAACGLTSGALAAFIGFPILLANSRFAATAGANYVNVFHALYHRAVNEGVLSLWKRQGGRHFAYGMMLHDMGMLASYDRSSNYFRESVGWNETRSAMGASFVSAFFAAACSWPCAKVGLTISLMKPDASGKYPYTGFWDCALKNLKSRPLVFFSGFPYSVFAVAPRVVVIWALWEGMRKREESF